MLPILGFLIVWTALSCFVSQIKNIPKFYQIFIFILLWLIIGLRHDVGIDYPMYKVMYDNPYHYGNYSTEPIWHILNDSLRWFGFKSRMFFLVSSGFTMLFFYKGISKLSPAFYASVILFILLDFYFETSNTVRQCAAMGALMWGYAEQQQKNYTSAIILAILAFCLHYSALFGIIFIIVSYIRIKPIHLIIAVVVSAIFGAKLMNIAINQFMPILADIGKYTYQVDKFDDGVSTGLLKYVYTALGMGILCFYKRLDSLSPNVYQLINLVTIGICLYCIFYTFQPARRLYMYGFMFIIILLPYFFKLFKNSSRILVTSTIYLVFLLFLIKSKLPVSYHFDFNIL